MRLLTYHPFVVAFTFEPFRQYDSRMPSEVMTEWFAKHIKGEFELLFCRSVSHFSSHDFYTNANKDFDKNVNFVFFQDEKDAMLFKLTWAGL